MRITRRDDVGVQVQVRCSDLRGDSTVGGLVLTLRDVTEQRQLEEELKHRAFHDALTGLPNRLLFQDRAAQRRWPGPARRHDRGRALRRPGRLQGRERHDGPQRRRRAAGGRRDAAFGRGPRVATRRRGSAATSSRCSSRMPRTAAAVEAFAERIVQAFGEPFALADGSVVATATVGVATTEDSADADELLRHADLALYAAKAAGKRQWRRYQPVLSAGHAQAAGAAGGARGRGDELRVHARLPADRGARHRRDRRVRGAGALAASRSGA